MMDERIPLLAVVGPTASGKTKLAVELALRTGGEVVSADSMQIYKGMAIGTARPTPEEMRGVPHHMIGVADPRVHCSVAQYAQAARACIAQIHARGRLPVLAGGTGLYVQAVVDNISFSPTQRDDALRRELERTARERGGEALLETLRAFDPETAGALHPNNVGRIIRAIEVYKTTGVTMAEQNRRSRLTPPPYRTLMLGLCFADRAELYRRIDRRVDAMLDAGLVNEVRRLLGAGVTRADTSLQAIGYKEIAAVLCGQTPPAQAALAQAVEDVKRESRRYAKRQLTWFRRDARIHWIEAGEAGGGAENICRQAFALVDKWQTLCYNNL